MARLKIQVTEEDLAYTPRRRYIEYDLFTRALGRKGLGGVLVVLIAGTEAQIPVEALELRERWLAGEEVQPFDFEITWGKSNLKYLAQRSETHVPLHVCSAS